MWTSTSRMAFVGDGNNTETKIVFAIITGGYSGSLSYSYVNYIALEGDTEATGTDFANFTADSNANLAVWTYPPCFVENTLISTRDGTKKVQDISYDDDTLVWNFDEGKLDYAKPDIHKTRTNKRLILARYRRGRQNSKSCRLKRQVS